MQTQTTVVQDTFNAKSPEIQNFQISVLKGSVNGIDTCLRKGEVGVDRPLKGGWSPLMFACSLGHAQIVDCLLNHGANPNFSKDSFSPLMAVCVSCKGEEKLLGCAELLVERGAAVDACDSFKVTPLMYAARAGHAQIVRYLVLRGADVQRADARGWTALFWAIDSGRISVVKLLLQLGALANLNEISFIKNSPDHRRQICSLFDDNNNNKNKKLDEEMQNGAPKKTSTTENNINSSITCLMSNINEYSLAESLRTLEELEKQLYREYETISYLRLRINSISIHEPRTSHTAMCKDLAKQTRATLLASERVFNNLKFLHSFTSKLTGTDEIRSVNFVIEKKTEVERNWASVIVTTLIIAVTILKTKTFGFFS